ncbi:MAG: ABC transporter substrate-binding protein, partial [Syntrophales bacterium]|nr:ABC transporter substrate-binding protein [Syntrophales bacterium]
MKKRLMLGVLVTAALLIAIPALVTPVAAAPPTGEPIVIGYVGMILSPGTRPCMDIQKIAVEEINQAGGILGRPVKYIVADNKGDTSLTVEGARRLLVEDKAKFISVEGRT